MQDDEIDLFDFFLALWDAKWLISSIVAIAVLLGGGVLFLKDPVYESRLIYSVHTTPPFVGKDIVLADFKKRFYSASIFEDWKKNNSTASIVFKDFSETEVVDGFVLTRSKGNQLAIITPENDRSSVVLIRSSQLKVLDDFFKYAVYINKLLRDEYTLLAHEELGLIESRFQNSYLELETVLLIDRFINTAGNGAGAVAIQRPSMPKIVSPRSSLILAMSVVLGGMVGVFFVLFRDVIKKREEQLAKA